MKFFVIFLLVFLSIKSGFCQLRGNAITCNEPDGTPIDIKAITGGAITKPCVRCTCQVGLVNCTIDECPQLKSCPLAEKPPPQNSSSSPICCPKCKSCNYLGIQRANNERWKSVQDPCYALTCKAGIVTSSRVQCTNHCSDGLNVPGYCCQLCKKSIEIKSDPCLQCDSVMGIWYHCYRLACPVLDCPKNLIKQIPNKCCPECIHPSIREYRTTASENPRLQGYCTFQLRRYELNEVFHHDACTRCHCQSGGIQCRRFTCPIRQCQISAKLLFRKNICCPFCQYTVTAVAATPISKNDTSTTYYEEFRSEKIVDQLIPFGNNNNNGKITTCIHKQPNGNVVIRKHNSFWKANDCLNCFCRFGKTKCERENCFPTEPFTCPKGSKKIKLIGKCCKFCEQYESTCTIFGDTNYETFDGLNYSFSGNKSYYLSQECGFDDNDDDGEDIDGDEKPNFAVIAHNNMFNEKNESYTGRISIIIKIQNSQKPLILQISKNRIFTENDRPIQIPKNTSVYSIIAENATQYIQLNIPSLGLKLKFDGQGFAELTLSTIHKGKVCGLCGNYNDRASDDLWPKYADSITENIEAFAASWKWKPAKASSSHRCKTLKLTTEKAGELAECRRLLDNKFFAFCRKQIHVHQYIRQCTKDVCECPTTNNTTAKPCFCHAIEAFATQCANRFIWGQWTQILSNVRQFPVHPQCDKIKKPI